MSGQAAALTASKDRGHFVQQPSSPTVLRESLSAERPPSLLDFYLSWMSPSSRLDFLLIMDVRELVKPEVFKDVGVYGRRLSPKSGFLPSQLANFHCPILPRPKAQNRAHLSR